MRSQGYLEPWIWRLCWDNVLNLRQAHRSRTAGRFDKQTAKSNFNRSVAWHMQSLQSPIDWMKICRTTEGLHMTILNVITRKYPYGRILPETVFYFQKNFLPRWSFFPAETNLYTVQQLKLHHLLLEAFSLFHWSTRLLVPTPFLIMQEPNLVKILHFAWIKNQDDPRKRTE